VSRRIDVSFDKPSTVEHLAPGSYQLQLSDLGPDCHAYASQVVDTNTLDRDRPFPVLVAASGSIRGTLAPATPTGRYVVLLLASAPTPGKEALLIAQPDSQSRFSFSGLAPGRYRIAAQPSTQTSRKRWVADLSRMFEIEVAGGGQTQIDLPAPLDQSGGR
jgi:hypothetical protein